MIRGLSAPYHLGRLREGMGAGPERLLAAGAVGHPPQGAGAARDADGRAEAAALRLLDSLAALAPAP